MFDMYSVFLAWGKLGDWLLTMFTRSHISNLDFPVSLAHITEILREITYMTMYTEVYGMEYTIDILNRR